MGNFIFFLKIFLVIPIFFTMNVHYLVGKTKNISKNAKIFLNKIKII